MLPVVLSNRDGGKGDDDIYTFVNNDPNLKIVNYILKEPPLQNNDDKDLEILGLAANHHTMKWCY